MDKFTIFRELLDYVAHNAQVTDADMDHYGLGDGSEMRIVGKFENETITIRVEIEKEVLKDAEKVE